MSPTEVEHITLAVSVWFGAWLAARFWSVVGDALLGGDND